MTSGIMDDEIEKPHPTSPKGEGRKERKEE